MPSQLLFCAWCVLTNSLVNYCIFDFLLCVTQKDGRRYLPIWLIASGLITVIAALLQLPGTFFIAVLSLVTFAKTALKIQNSDLAAPITIIFTFYTFLEGCSAFVMSWVSSHFQSPTGGKMEQIFIPLFLDILFLGVLQIMKKRYSYSLRQSIPSYLYILMLPCAMIVLLIRYGLRLDGRGFEQHLASFGVTVRFAVLFSMLGAAVIVFMMMEAFCKIIQLTGHKKAAEEAEKRSELYASFQHDIDNHLLVISGLLQGKQFAQAEQYTRKLHLCCGKPLLSISTGKPILDVLLREKLSYAKQNHIIVSYDVAIPSDFAVDDMDLCVLFSNILDNANAACMEGTEEVNRLSLSANVRSQFLVVEAVNTTSATQPIVWGTGLMNIQHIAGKYNGTVETELSNGQFRISVLLCSH